VITKEYQEGKSSHIIFLERNVSTESVRILIFGELVDIGNIDGSKLAK